MGTFRDLFKSTRRKKHQPRRTARRMTLEPLERRELLAAVSGLPTMDGWRAADASAAAVVGSLDPTFGTNGLIRTNLAGNDAAAAVAIQPNGRIVVAGAVNNEADFGLVRYLPTGELDRSFGPNRDGKVLTHFAGVDRARAMVIDSQGRIIVAGGANNDADFGLVRYRPDGTLDTTFGPHGTGMVTTHFSGVDRAYALALDSLGRIIVAGAVNNDADFGLARYTANGLLDLSFGPDRNGKVVTHFSGVDRARAVAVHSDGTILVAGGVNNDSDFGLARYNANGTLDTSFGPDRNGKVITHFSGVDRAHALVVQPDGKIVVAGSANNDADFGLARYTASGRLDTTFGPDGNGKVITHFAGVDRARALVLQPDGKIIVVGGVNNDADFGVARYHSNGRLDTSFGQGGKVVTNIAGTDWAAAVALQTDGKIVVAGLGGGDFALARYLNDVPPSAPTALSAQSVTSNSVTLAWRDNANNETGFRIEWREAGRDWLSTTIAANSTQHTVTGLRPSTRYEFRICAVNHIADSPYAGPITAQTTAAIAGPAAPSELWAQPATSTSVTLNWRDNANNETGFRVQWREVGMTWQSTSIAANSTQHTIGGLRPATRYEFRVCSFNSAGDSAFTATVSAQTPAGVVPPSAPSQLTSPSITSSSVTLNWTDNANNETGFRVQWREVGQAWQSTTIAANSTRHTIGGLKPATSYEFRVCAFNGLGDSSYAGPISVRTPSLPVLPPVAAVPSPPSQLVAQVASGNGITLTWKDNSSNETGFRIQWREAGKTWQSIIIAANSTRHTIAGLSPTMRYDFRVCALNAAGDSSYAEATFVASKPHNLVAGEQLLPGQTMHSADGRYRFTLQTDGNLVLYGPAGRALWSTGTAGRRVTRAVMQSDGNFILYNDSTAVWHTRTHGHSGARLVVLDTGNVVIRAVGGKILWQARQV